MTPPYRIDGLDLDDLDRRIHGTLHALGHADPAADLETRLLQNLARHGASHSATVVSSPHSRSLLKGVFLSLKNGVLSTAAKRLLGSGRGETTPFRQLYAGSLAKPALVASAAVFLALFFAHHAAPPATQPASHLNTSSLTPQHQSARSAAPFTPAPQSPRAYTKAGAPSLPAVVSPVKADLLPPLRPTLTDPRFHLQLTLSATNPTGAPDPDQQALADLQTPSFPAPPLPPTRQERLVRLMLRRGEKQELAQLDPAQAAAFALRDQRDFQAFFNPPARAPESLGAPLPAEQGIEPLQHPVDPGEPPNLFPPYKGDPQ